MTPRRAPVPPRPRLPAWLAWTLFTALALAACSPDRAAYDAAVARMDALDGKVDAAFDAARGLHGELFAQDAWDDPEALAARIDQARGHMAEVLADHDRRVATEAGLLDMDALKKAANTRLLYRMDLEAQQAKREVFVETADMYDDLARAVAARDPKAYARAAEAHGARIDQANARYRELDLARQRRQSPPEGP